MRPVVQVAAIFTSFALAALSAHANDSPAEELTDQAWSYAPETVSRAPAGVSALVLGARSPANDSLKNARQYLRQGQYFTAARYAFSAAEEEAEAQPAALAVMTQGLARAGLWHAATYFFVRTLQTQNREAIREVLPLTQELLYRTGGDLIRRRLTQFTRIEDFNAENRSAYLYAYAKEALLKGQYDAVAQAVGGIKSGSPLFASALQLRATAYAIQGKNDQALSDFKKCASEAGSGTGALSGKRSRTWERNEDAQAADLKNRCIAGEARTLYQMDQFNEAERVWDRVPKASFVWTDILFEQAWNAFAKGEYNRTLGKLVTYKSPGLGFVFNSEVDVLRAQAYYALCLYDDVGKSITEFETRYAQVGEQVKRFVESKSADLAAFYDEGKKAAKGPLHTRNDQYRMLNRFVRSPYFQRLLGSELEIQNEMNAVAQFARSLPGASASSQEGFPGFVNVVLKWRMKTLSLLGGAFVKNSLIDAHTTLVGDFEKMSFIKIEMLKGAKEQLASQLAGASPAKGEDRARGNVIPSRRDNQYRWTFNGEFWNDELGDYVFGLESACGKKEGV